MPDPDDTKSPFDLADESKTPCGYDTNTGLTMFRRLLVEATDHGLPIAINLTDALSPQFTSDLCSLGILDGAFSGSMPSCELVSGLPFAVGYRSKLTSIHETASVMKSAAEKHHFLSTTETGLLSVVGTAGNPDTFAIIGGESTKPEDWSGLISATKQALVRENVNLRLMIDCTNVICDGHGQCASRHGSDDMEFVSAAARWIAEDQDSIIGVMIGTSSKGQC
jgi:3-deoxy-7-phosphoheptulonate synthase